jgi:Ran GTPase-activating protein (RanGAP) involved in mRNA processing and transport
LVSGKARASFQPPQKHHRIFDSHSALFRGLKMSENATQRPKDAIYGWTWLANLDILDIRQFILGKRGKKEKDNNTQTDNGRYC